MAIDNVGKSLVLQENKVYLMISDFEDSVTFNVIDTLDHDNNEDAANFLSAMARGLIQMALDSPIEVINKGIDAFKKDAQTETKGVNGKPVLPPVSEVIKDVPGDEGTVVQFPWKTQGNA
jgi:hypothetical protein